MKKLIVLVLCVIMLCSCSANESHRDFHVGEKTYRVESIGNYDGSGSQKVMNGIWVSQFDMSPLYRDGSRQREQSDFENRVQTMIQSLKKDGFDTVFLQIRPNGDSIYKSDIYPTSKYIAGSYGGEIDYDAVEIFLETAKKSEISVHAWINPYRLCSENELLNYGKGLFYDWYKQGIGKRIEKGDDGLLYLDPSYEEVTEVIVSGVSEALSRYDFDGIHLDDYFYPTEFEFDDEKEFLASSFSDLGEFRRNNVNKTVKAIYNEVHRFDNKVFGIAPAGNIYSLSNGWYADVYTWCKQDGYIDYIMPQLYYGFNNAVCPFEQILSDWCNAVTNEKIELYIGLSAAKCELGTKGLADAYAGEKGKYEWRDNKDILARSLQEIYDKELDGFCIFSYSSFYNPLTGDNNPLTKEEKSVFCELMAK